MSETETLLSFKKGSPPRSPGGGSRNRRQYGGTTKENELKGEQLLLQNDVGAENNYTSNNRNTPQSVEPQNGISPLSTTGLPPIPLRRRADSGSSVGSSPGYGNDISPNLYLPSTTGVPPKHRRSNSPKQQHPSQRRRSHSPSPNSTPGSNYSDNNIVMNNNNFNMNMQQINNAHHPLYSNSNNHQRRSSDTYNPILEHYNHHRRTHSYDATPQHQQTSNLRRGNSSLSLYSLQSQSSTRSMNSETMKLLPDPRWGGGSGGSRTRSYSGGSSYNMGSSALNVMNSYSTPSSSTAHHNSNDANGMLKRSNSNPLGSYSTDSEENKIFNNNNGTTGYGSIASTSTGKEVISTSGGTGEMMQQQQPLRRNHRRTNSDMSASTYASAISIDRSVDPVMTDMTKSAMFKGVTNDGVVKLQLPKDNFRLLSDRDLGKMLFAVFLYMLSDSSCICVTHC